MPQKAIEVPIQFPANRKAVIKIRPDATILDLKRSICKQDAIEVLAAGDNADLLGKRFTAPATFRLILKGLELSSDGTLEYYHLTTKGVKQQAVKVVAKHESLIDDDEVLEEDFAIPESVAHLEEEAKQREEEEKEKREADKLRHQTFHQKSPSKRRKSSSSTSPHHHVAAGAGGSRPDSAASTSMSFAADNNTTSNIPTPEPVFQPQPNRFPTHRHHLPPMAEMANINNANANNASNIQYSSLNSSTVSGSFHQHNSNFIVPTSPSRGVAPLVMPQSAAIFALPLDEDPSAMMNNTSGSGGGGGSPDILTKMKQYLGAAERGEAPLPQVLPLPGSVAGGGSYQQHHNLTPPRGMQLLAPMNTSNSNIKSNNTSPNYKQKQNQQQQQQSNTQQNINDENITVTCTNPKCHRKLQLDVAQDRITQLEAAVDRYKMLLHRMIGIQEQNNQNQNQNNNTSNNNVSAFQQLQVERHQQQQSN